MREAFTSGECCACIDDHYPVMQRLGESCQRNSNMPRTYNQECRRRRKALYEYIESQCTGLALHAVSMRPCIPIPDCPLSIFSNQHIKRGITKCPTRSPTWINQ